MQQEPPLGQILLLSTSSQSRLNSGLTHVPSHAGWLLTLGVLSFLVRDSESESGALVDEFVGGAVVLTPVV